LVSVGQNECSYLENDFNVARNFVYIRVSHTAFRRLFVGGPLVPNDCSSVRRPSRSLYC
jgi:hypothetical protein